MTYSHGGDFFPQKLHYMYYNCCESTTKRFLQSWGKGGIFFPVHSRRERGTFFFLPNINFAKPPPPPFRPLIKNAPLSKEEILD